MTTTAFRRVAALLLVVSAAAVQAAPVLHVGATLNNSSAYVFDWQGGARVALANNQGRADGDVVVDGAQRTVTLDSPIPQSQVISDPDCPELQSEVRIDLWQVRVTIVSGTANRGESDVAEAGTQTTISGCNAGRVEPWGSLIEGLRTKHLAAALRPSTSDLVPGSTLAGPSEAPGADDPFPAADIVTIGDGSVSFAASGHVYALSMADGWWRVGLPGGDRAYTRFSIDRRSGAEVWVQAEWAADTPQRVFQRAMVQPEPGAGFGGLWRTSRVWEGGLFVGTPTLFFIELYRDGNGARVSLDTLTGNQSRSPITWAYDGTAIVQTRQLGTDTGRRTWRPLRNSGQTRFVLEDEVIVFGDGSTQPFIAPRVNLYLDRGPASPPARH